MDRNQFEALVSDAVDAIPATFSRFLDNVVFLVEPLPDEETLSEMGITDPTELMGLYLGAPLTERSIDDWGMLPDQIILFQRSIERYAQETGQPVVETIRDTILHEVGHFFGLTEEDLERMGIG